MAKAKEMMSVEKTVYVNLTRRVRTLEDANAKLEAYMKVISEAASESQTRVRVYSKREGAPTDKRPLRSNGDRVQQRDTRPVLRGSKPLLVDGVQIPTFNSTTYKPNFTKASRKTKPSATEVVSSRD